MNTSYTPVQVSRLCKALKGFTLIELIIVVIIVAILAATALPKYYANIRKAKKESVYATLDIMRQAALSYYAVYGVYPMSWPINVVVEGDTIVNMSRPSNPTWTYYLSFDYTGYCSDATGMVQAKSTDNCWFRMCVPSGERTESVECASL